MFYQVLWYTNVKYLSNMVGAEESFGFHSSLKSHDFRFDLSSVQCWLECDEIYEIFIFLYILGKLLENCNLYIKLTHFVEHILYVTILILIFPQYLMFRDCII